MTSTTVTPGDFKSLGLPDWDVEMLTDAYQAVTKANMWDFLKRDDVPGVRPCGHCGSTAPPERQALRSICRVCMGKGEVEQGFMFNDFAEMKLIDKELKYDGHSGASYGFTMRVMEMIAKKGWDAYAEEKLAKQKPKPKAKTEFDQFLDMISPSTKHVKEDTTLTPQQKREKFLALPTDMTLDEQAKALRELKDVPMTYAEMRMRFG